MNWTQIIFTFILLLALIVMIYQYCTIRKLYQKLNYYRFKMMINSGRFVEFYGILDPFEDAYNYVKDKLGGAFNTAADAINSAVRYMMGKVGDGLGFFEKNLGKVASAVADYGGSAAIWVKNKLDEAASLGLELTKDALDFAGSSVGEAAKFLREKAEIIGIDPDDMAVILCGQITSGETAKTICQSIAKNAGKKKDKSSSDSSDSSSSSSTENNSEILK